jgi:hypothetical protein
VGEIDEATLGRRLKVKMLVPRAAEIDAAAI